MHRYPNWRDELHVATWPSGTTRVFATREFRLADRDGNELGAATSGWLLVDLESRRPKRPPQAIVELGESSPPRTFDDPFARLPEAPATPTPHRVTASFFDLDVNRHVNNVTLIRWAIEAIPAATLASSELAEIEVEFRSEVVAEDAVESNVAATEGPGAEFLHRLVRLADQRDIVLARTAWRPRG
jgi:acyl-ACP thioesterase